MAKGKYQEWLEPDGLLRLEAWARDGLTDEDIATNMGVSVKTLYNYKTSHLPILHALKRGKEVADIIVENSLFKRATGYSYNEEKYTAIEMNQDEYYVKQASYVNEYKLNHPEATLEEINQVKQAFPKTEMVLIERKTKEVVPDVTAQIFWLKNRKPKEWRDKQQHEHSGGVQVNPFADLTTEELKKLIEE